MHIPDALATRLQQEKAELERRNKIKCELQVWHRPMVDITIDA
jgi:hypothetical protein